jgi:hypothetical protein
MRTPEIDDYFLSSRRTLLRALATGLTLVPFLNSSLFGQLDLREISTHDANNDAKIKLKSSSHKKKKLSEKKIEETTSGSPKSETGEPERPETDEPVTDESEKTEPNPQQSGGPVFTHPTRTKYRIGLSLEARPNGECNDVFGSVPFPMSFPDQKVRIIEDEHSDHVKIRYRDLKEGGCRQLLIRIKTLYPGEKADAIVTVELTRFNIAPPESPYDYVIPKSVPKNIREYLNESPYIETTNAKIKKTAKKVVSDDDKDWRKVENILRFVRESIKYKEAYKEKPVRGALAALETGEGDCEDLSTLFIALCRINGIPARTVRVPEHCWAEFYLEDSAKNGYWFPAQVAGNEPLGYSSDHRMILQKGDAFRIPESRREISRYVVELFTGKVKQSGADPIHRFVREEVR